MLALKISQLSIRQLGLTAQKEVQYEAEIGHLRHSRFMGFRDDKHPREVVREE
jgi:hypothetical protein